MNRATFAKWLHRIYSTAEAEIDCDAMQEILPAYVDHEMAGHDPAAQLPQASLHLAQCPDCADEYRALREVARLETQGRLPKAEETLAVFQAAAEADSAEIRAIPAP